VAPIELWSVVRKIRAVVSGDAVAALIRQPPATPAVRPDPGVLDELCAAFRAVAPVAPPLGEAADALAGLAGDVRAGRYDRAAATRALTAVHQATGRALLSGLDSSSGLTPDEAVEVAGQTTPGGRHVLASHRLARASRAVAALSPADAARLRTLLGGSSPVRRAYLLAALAAGHLLARVEKLAADTSAYAHDDGWLHRHLGLLDGGVGPASYADEAGGVVPLRQLAPVTCGPTSLIVLRALVDPVYALELTTGGNPADPARSSVRAVEQRFRAEQSSVHHAATRDAVGPLPWPKRFGTPPWGAARFLNRLSWVTGVEYDWQPVDNSDPEQLRQRLVAITGGLALGVPVPLYIGKQVDRHVVLAFGHESRRLRLYEPSRGAVVTVGEDDVLQNRLGAAGWDRLEGVLTPAPARPGGS
jgi:hypothetical protein